MYWCWKVMLYCKRFDDENSITRNPPKNAPTWPRYVIIWVYSPSERDILIGSMWYYNLVNVKCLYGRQDVSFFSHHNVFRLNLTNESNIRWFSFMIFFYGTLSQPTIVWLYVYVKTESCSPHLRRIFRNWIFSLFLLMLSKRCFNALVVSERLDLHS